MKLGRQTVALALAGAIVACTWGKAEAECSSHVYQLTGNTRAVDYSATGVVGDPCTNEGRIRYSETDEGLQVCDGSAYKAAAKSTAVQPNVPPSGTRDAPPFVCDASTKGAQFYDTELEVVHTCKGAGWPAGYKTCGSGKQVGYVCLEEVTHGLTYTGVVKHCAARQDGSRMCSGGQWYALQREGLLPAADVGGADGRMWIPMGVGDDGLTNEKFGVIVRGNMEGNSNYHAFFRDYPDATDVYGGCCKVVIPDNKQNEPCADTVGNICLTHTFSGGDNHPSQAHTCATEDAPSRLCYPSEFLAIKNDGQESLLGLKYAHHENGEYSGYDSPREGIYHPGFCFHIPMKRFVECFGSNGNADFTGRCCRTDRNVQGKADCESIEGFAWYADIGVCARVNTNNGNGFYEEGMSKCYGAGQPRGVRACRHDEVYAMCEAGYLDHKDIADNGKGWEVDAFVMNPNVMTVKAGGQCTHGKYEGGGGMGQVCCYGG